MHHELTEAEWQRFLSRVDDSGGEDSCWPWLGSHDRKGYGVLSIGKDPHRKAKRAHALALQMATGSATEARLVRHLCGARDCVNPRHLAPGDDKENADDRERMGRTARGEKLAKRLSDAAVREIRVRLAAGAFASDIAPLYGVSDTMVRRIRRGLAWRHVV